MGMPRIWWGGPPGPRGFPWTRSSLEESGSCITTRTRGPIPSTLTHALPAAACHNGEWRVPVRRLSLLLALWVPATAQVAPMLNLVVLEGEGATNNIRQRTAREPIVQVQDENHKPVAGAIIVFTLPSNGAGGAFANGARTLSMVSDNQGQAVARGFRPNGL